MMDHTLFTQQLGQLNHAIRDRLLVAIRDHHHHQPALIVKDQFPPKLDQTFEILWIQRASYFLRQCAKNKIQAPLAHDDLDAVLKDHPHWLFWSQLLFINQEFFKSHPESFSWIKYAPTTDQCPYPSRAPLLYWFEIVGVHMGVFHGDDVRDNSFGGPSGFLNDDVTHWQPLPIHFGPPVPTKQL